MNDIASRFTTILGRLCATVGAFMAAQARGPQLVWLGTQAFSPIIQPNRATPLPPETWILLTHRLARLAHRFRTLFARYQAGTLPAPPPPRAQAARQRPPVPRLPVPRLPGKTGWIGARIADAAPCAGSIEHLLHNEPEMRDFVRQAPQAGRVLRPLARMLGVTLPAYLRLPPRPKRAPAFSRPALGRGGWAAKRTDEEGSAANPQPTPDRPLPPNIRAAARAWKKYDR